MIVWQKSFREVVVPAKIEIGNGVLELFDEISRCLQIQRACLHAKHPATKYPPGESGTIAHQHL
jgi:hypothetical protein